MKRLLALLPLVFCVALIADAGKGCGCQKPPKKVIKTDKGCGCQKPPVKSVPADKGCGCQKPPRQ